MLQDLDDDRQTDMKSWKKRSNSETNCYQILTLFSQALIFDSLLQGLSVALTPSLIICHNLQPFPLKSVSPKLFRPALLILSPIKFVNFPHLPSFLHPRSYLLAFRFHFHCSLLLYKDCAGWGPEGLCSVPSRSRLFPMITLNRSRRYLNLYLASFQFNSG